MISRESVKSIICKAFAHVQYPGDWCLRGSSEGEEPFKLEHEFKGKTDWSTLEASFLDQAPDGFGSALSFFSDEAFHFYLPAYLIADIDGLLESADPTFHLTYGFTDDSKNEKVNPIRYGERTWFDSSSFKCSIFTSAEREAIVAYLNLKKTTDYYKKSSIEEALKNYWTNPKG